MAERLIDAEALEEKIRESIGIIKRNLLMDKESWDSNIRLVWYKKLLEMVENVPTIEAKAVAHAHWKEGVPFHQCSRCNGFALSFDNEPYRKEILSNYCPHCGAQMDEVVDHIAEDRKKERE